MKDTETSGLAVAMRLLESSGNAKALLDILPDQMTATHENILVGATREIDELREALSLLLHDYGLMGRSLRMEVAELRAFAHSGEVLEALRAMVSAQHAGPITDEMYAAWERARALLQATDVSPGGPG